MAKASQVFEIVKKKIMLGSNQLTFEEQGLNYNCREFAGLSYISPYFLKIVWEKPN